MASISGWELWTTEDAWLPVAVAMGFREDFQEHGFVLLHGAIEQPLLGELQAAVQPLLAHYTGSGRVRRHQTVLEPDWFQPAFLGFLNLERTNRAAAEIIGVDHPSELSACGLALLMGHDEEGTLGWHRDFGDDHPESPALWQRSCSFIQTNCALFDDPSLWVVPASHDRPSTPQELANNRTPDGPKPVGEHAVALGAVPGAKNVILMAGDCLLYNPLNWHAVSYLPSRIRATFHGGWRHPTLPYELETMRWGLDQNPWFADTSYMGSDLGCYYGGQLNNLQKVMRRFGKPKQVTAQSQKL